MLKIFFGLRLLFRFLPYLIREIRAGNPYAIGGTILFSVAVVVAGMAWFARRPLGGDPEKLPVSDDDFQDKNNPYRIA